LCCGAVSICHPQGYFCSTGGEMNLRHLAIIVFIMSTCFAGLAYSSDYAVVNFQKAVELCSLGQGARQKMKSTFNEYDREVMAMQEQLKQIKDRLERAEKSVDKTDLENKYKEEVSKYKAHTVNLKITLNKKNAEYTKTVLDKVVECVKLYNKQHRTEAADKKYLAIFEKGGNQSLQDSRDNKQISASSVDLKSADDITGEIIKLMDEKYPYEKNSHLFE
jgi:Skp family chaperone for outer membrane proteins